MADIFSSLFMNFFHFSSMSIKECCLSCDFLKPVTHFEILLSIKLLIGLKITLSKTFGICGNNLTGL